MSNAPVTSPSTRKPATIAWLRLARIYQKIDRRSAVTLGAHNLSVSRFDVLNHAGSPEGRTQQQLAESLLVTKGNITQLVDAMERDGLLTRQRDGRFKRIYLTEEGRALRAAAIADQEAALASEFALFNEAELACLVRLLRELDHHLDSPP